jgi:tRNA(fMet)-specific endonuclease VapC
MQEALRGRLGFLARPLSGPARIKAYGWLVDTLELFRQFSTVPFDTACESAFQQLRAQRLHIGSQDLRIAAVALAHRLVLLTRNQRDFGRIPNLALDNWSV